MIDEREEYVGWEPGGHSAPASERSRPPATSSRNGKGAGAALGASVQQRWSDGVLGIARAVQSRTEMMGQGGALQVLTLRLERHDDQGNRLQPVAVQMRGIRIEGAVGDGELVEVHGTVKHGTIRCKELYDHDTQSLVRLSPGLERLKKGVIVVALGILAIAIVAGGFSFLTSLGGGDPKSRRQEVLEQCLAAELMPPERCQELHGAVSTTAVPGVEAPAVPGVEAPALPGDVPEAPPVSSTPQEEFFQQAYDDCVAEGLFPEPECQRLYGG